MATIDRKELYKKVWETPITRLAREYGLSDVGFAKICKNTNPDRPWLLGPKTLLHQFEDTKGKAP